MEENEQIRQLSVERTEPDSGNFPGSPDSIKDAESGVSSEDSFLLIACSWICVLSTVFLAGATLNILFQWLAYGLSHDLAGLIFSAAVAAICYRYAISTAALSSPIVKMQISLALLIIWICFFPLILHGFGFK